MPKQVEFMLDREGNSWLKFELSSGGQLLSVSRFEYDQVSGKQIRRPFYQDATDPMDYALSLKWKATQPDGEVIFEEIKYGDLVSGTYNVNFSMNESDQVECWFDGKLKIGSITYADGDLLIEQNKFQPIIPTEIRLVAHQALPETSNKPEELPSGLYLPQSDLHTHFAGIMSADILLAGLKEKQKNQEAVQYPVQYLLKAGIKIEDLRPYFNESSTEFEQFQDQLKQGSGETTFDITKLVSPDYADDPICLENLKKFREILHIPSNKTIIFDQMEQYYEYRDILIKDPKLFSFFLEKIAEDYHEQGIKYVEISFSKVTDPAWLFLMEQTLPEIEAKYDVQIRFLGIIARTAPYDVRMAQVDLFEKVASVSPYVMGIDLLAAEINSTYDCLHELIEICEWANAHFPGMVVRIHAGETSYHPENVAAVVRLAKNYPDLKFRIGHGIHGVHQDVISEIAQLENIIPEINMASNVALNMRGDIAHHTLYQYIKASLPIVLGSDGHGLYQTENSDLIKLLCYAEEIDIPEFVGQLERLEAQYIHYVNAVFPERVRLFMITFMAQAEQMDLSDEIAKNLGVSFKALQDSLTLPSSESNAQNIVTLFEKVKRLEVFQRIWEKIFEHYPEIKHKINVDAQTREQLNQELVQKNHDQVKEFCEFHRIQLVSADQLGESKEKNPDSFEKKTPLMIQGMIYSDDDREQEENILKTIAVVKTLLDQMEPSEFYFVTTGTDIGIQRIIHEVVGQYNVRHPERKFDLVAFIPENMKVDQLSPQITHLLKVEHVRNIYGLYEYIDHLVRTRDLKLMTIGGNMWNKDIIQIVDNAIKETRDSAVSQGQMFLMSSIPGASAEKAKELSKSYSYADFEGLLVAVLGETHAQEEIIACFQNHWHETIAEHAEVTIPTLQGRIHSSTPEEMARKAFPILSQSYHGELFLEDLTSYFSARLNRKEVNHLALYGAMENDKSLRKSVEQISQEFNLPREKKNLDLKAQGGFFENRRKSCEDKVEEQEIKPQHKA